MAPWRRPLERWAFPACWLLAPFVAGPAFAATLDPRSPAVRATASVGLWLVWGATLAAALVPRTVTLTAVRIVAPATLAAAGWAALVAPDPGGADAVALAYAAVVTAVALSAGTGDAFANGSSYGDERRFPLRPPGALLAGPIEVAWTVVVVGVVTGPLLLAAHQWVVGAAALAGGWFLAAVAARVLHGLSRRWLVFTPAGVVVHDPMVVVEAVLVLRRHLASLRPAPAGTTARDLTMGAPGTALQIDLTEAIPITPRPTRRPGQPAPPIESEDVSAVLVRPSRPGVVLSEAADRRLPVTT